MIDGLKYHTPVVETRILKADVTNTSYDRRFRHGIYAHQVIKAGQRFKTIIQDLEVEGKPETRRTVQNDIVIGHTRISKHIMDTRKDKQVENPLFLAIMDASEVINDVQAVFSKNLLENMSDVDFAKVAIGEGFMTQEQVEFIVRNA